MLTAAPFPVKGHSTARACTSLFCTGKEERLATLWLEGPLEQPQHDVMSEICYRLCVGRVWAERQWRLEESHIYSRVEVIWEITAAGSSARPEVWSTPHPAYSCLLLQHRERISFLRSSAKYYLYWKHESESCLVEVEILPASPWTTFLM